MSELGSQGELVPLNVRIGVHPEMSELGVTREPGALKCQKGVTMRTWCP